MGIQGISTVKPHNNALIKNTVLDVMQNWQLAPVLGLAPVWEQDRDESQGWGLKSYARCGDRDLGVETKVMKVKERHVKVFQKKRWRVSLWFSVFSKVNLWIWPTNWDISGITDAILLPLDSELSPTIFKLEPTSTTRWHQITALSSWT